MKIKLSKKGRDFNGNKLNEDSPLGFCVYEKNIYSCGNRYHDQVELYTGIFHVRNVEMKNIRIFKLVK